MNMNAVVQDACDLSGLTTPSLILDQKRLLANVSRLRTHLAGLGVPLRPHMKTAKSLDVARHLLSGPTDPITVSTLKEAEVFAKAGYRDILYAVGIAPQKLRRIQALRNAGCDVSVVLDSMEQADAVALACQAGPTGVPVLLEIDCDGHRSGLQPDDPMLVTIAERLVAGGACLRGIITHAGESYGAKGEEALAAFAERERTAAVAAADLLRAAGHECPVVSVGSTPTALFARDLTGVSEVRAGVFMFFDLFMAGVGVCTTEDIALSVLTTVIGHQKERKWIVVDAGWMAMSRDRGTANQAVDQGYGVVCDVRGRPYEDLILAGANQEHGIITRRANTAGEMPDLPVGTQLRILPNHACATGAQFSQYEVLPADGSNTLASWPRFSGW